jgi:hypothetical protein
MLLSRHLFIAVIVASVASVGCKTTNPSASTQSVPRRSAPSDLSGKGGTPATQGIEEASTPAPGTAEALAQRANTYAKSVGPLLHPTPKNPEPNVGNATPNSSGTLHPPTATDAAAPKSDINDSRAFAAVPNKADVQVQKQTPTPSQTQNPVPATDAQTAAFARRAAEYPQDLSAQTDFQLLKLLQEESVPDLQSMAGLAPEDRELLSALMDSLTNFRNQLRQNNNMLISKKIAPLVELGDRLKSQAELTIPTFTFVSQAPGFGRYQALEPARFMAGKPHVVGIYYEVENFSSRLNENNLYETRLNENLVLYTESSGLPVWQDRKSTLTDTSHRRRHDFFNAKNITLPASLTIGRYLLKVTIEDQQAQHIAEATVPVEIVAQ